MARPALSIGAVVVGVIAEHAGAALVPRPGGPPPAPPPRSWVLPLLHRRKSIAMA